MVADGRGLAEISRRLETEHFVVIGSFLSRDAVSDLRDEIRSADDAGHLAPASSPAARPATPRSTPCATSVATALGGSAAPRRTWAFAGRVFRGDEARGHPRQRARRFRRRGATSPPDPRRCAPSAPARARSCWWRTASQRTPLTALDLAPVGGGGGRSACSCLQDALRRARRLHQLRRTKPRASGR